MFNIFQIDLKTVYSWKRDKRLAIDLLINEMIIFSITLPLNSILWKSSNWKQGKVVDARVPMLRSLSRDQCRKTKTIRGSWMNRRMEIAEGLYCT